MLNSVTSLPQVFAALAAGAHVLTSTQRQAHWLKLRYAQHALAQGFSAWLTPAVESFDAFVAHLWREHAASHVRVLSTQQSKLVWQRVVAESSWAELLLDPGAAADNAFRSWQRLRAWRIDRAMLAEAAQQTDEARALLEWADEFAARCRTHGWLPQAQLTRELCKISPQRLPGEVLVLMDELTPDQQALLDHLCSSGVRCQQVSLREDCASAALVECDSIEHELESAATWARGQLQAGRAHIGVAVPGLAEYGAERGDEVKKIFADVFAQATRSLDADVSFANDRAQQEASFSIAAYHRLVDFPLAQIALDLLELAQGRAASTLVGAVLRNPYIIGSDMEAAMRANIDVRLRSLGREHFDLAALMTYTTECPALQQALNAALQVKSRIKWQSTSRALPSQWAEYFTAIWRAFAWPEGVTLSSDEQQVRARVFACVAEFGALDEILGPLSTRAALHEFSTLLRSTAFEPRSRPAPVILTDVGAAHEFVFDALWVCGMDESRWPAPTAPDPFIPVSLQIEAGMPFAGQASRERMRKRFQSLRHSAAHVTFSFAKLDDDVQMRVSPWLHSLQRSAHAEPAAPYAQRIFQSRPELETFTEERGTPMTMEAVRGGARVFELQASCPFRAYTELRLGAVPLDSVAPRVAAHERGLLIHAALADVWRELRDSDGLRARSDAELESAVRTSLARHANRLLEGASPHRVRMLHIEQELAAERILELLRLDRARPPFRVVGEPEAKTRVSLDGLNLDLRLDRVDELLDAAHRGAHVIVDYKTGGNVSVASWFRDRPDQPQLPLYATTHDAPLAAVAFATLSAQDVGYRGVAQSNGVLPGVQAFANRGIEMPSARSDWEALLAYWKNVVAGLGREFAAGDARIEPLITACRYCHLSTLCRVQEQALDAQNADECEE